MGDVWGMYGHVWGMGIGDKWSRGLRPGSFTGSHVVKDSGDDAVWMAADGGDGGADGGGWGLGGGGRVGDARGGGEDVVLPDPEVAVAVSLARMVAGYRRCFSIIT